MVFYGLLSLLFCILVSKSPSIYTRICPPSRRPSASSAAMACGFIPPLAACSAVPYINRLLVVRWALALRGQVWPSICWR
ncbi:hypothetical protein F4780DRAFT_728686 [Xylariomycetidae sp. FL0641]|nr:hypothetical protein F4780DRAFT_728686 [Xylariomycetidae sp. FL0641]